MKKYQENIIDFVNIHYTKIRNICIIIGFIIGLLIASTFFNN